MFVPPITLQRPTLLSPTPLHFPASFYTFVSPTLVFTCYLLQLFVFCCTSIHVQLPLHFQPSPRYTSMPTCYTSKPLVTLLYPFPSSIVLLPPPPPPRLHFSDPHYTSLPSITLLCPSYTTTPTSWTSSTTTLCYYSVRLLHFQPFPSSAIHLWPASRPCSPPVGHTTHQ